MSATAPDPRIAFFDHHAPTWDTEGPPADIILPRLDALRPQLDLTPGKNVLEVGCGTGLITAWLETIVAPGSVTAIDFAPQMIAHAQKRGLKVQFRCEDICTTDYTGLDCDAVFCMHSFPHFRDQPAALRSMAGALRPGGRLLVLHLDNCHKINEFHAALDGPVNTDLLPEPSAWPALISEAGLHLVEIVDGTDLFLVRAKRVSNR